MSEKILTISNLTKTFKDQENPQEILSNVNFELDNHEFLCVLGPSGCGKTTLLRCIAGFEKHEGEIYVNGEKKDAPGADCIMVFQDFNQLFPWKSVEQNIIYPLKLQGEKDKAVLKQKAAEALKKVKLEGYGKYYPFQLSGGMKQRVAIAKALALKSKLILMDEPFAALDAMTRRDLQNEMTELFENEECTIIFITHNIQEAVIMGTRIIVMGKRGRIVVDERNKIPKPVTPASEGYGEVWKRLYDALYAPD